MSLDILPVNDAPTAHHIELSTVEDVTVEFDLRQLASDVENSFDELTISFEESWLGDIEFLADQSNARFTTNSDMSMEDLWFSVTDPDGLESWNYIDLTVEAVNDAPIAYTISPTTLEDQPLWIELGELASDAETPLEQLVFTFHAVHGGTVEQHDEYSAVFTPDKDHNGEAHFLFTVSDRGEPVLSDTGGVRINVITVNDAPRVHDFTLATMEDTNICCGGGTEEPLSDGHTALFPPEADSTGEVEAWFHVTDEEEDDWGSIALEFESTCAADAVFAELGDKADVAVFATLRLSRV